MIFRLSERGLGLLRSWNRRLADDAGARLNTPSPKFCSHDTVWIESMLKTLSQCGIKVILSENKKNLKINGVELFF